MENSRIYMVAFTLGLDRTTVLTRINGKVCFPARGRWPIPPEPGQAWEVMVDSEQAKVAFITPVTGPFMSLRLGASPTQALYYRTLGEPDATWVSGMFNGKPVTTVAWLRYSWEDARAKIEEARSDLHF